MIVLDNVDFYIEGHHIIRDVSFTIDEGETVAVIGESGSGKSTLLKLILGLYTPTSGSVLIDGVDISKLNAKEIREVRKQIGMVFQDGALFDSLTVGENVGYYLMEHSNLKLEDIEEEVISMLNFVGLDPELRDSLPDELSGGMQRRVAIARALISTRPRIMMYDEPTTGLDPRMLARVSNIILKISEPRNVSQIIVTHQIADAFHLAKRFIMIDSGRIIFDGGGNQLLKSQNENIIKFLRPFNASLTRHYEMLEEVNNKR
jgi:phospholipid/cholesterol/gamma-HCH transport system ATP-binding protein